MMPETPETLRESRRIMRLIQEHLLQVHEKMGALHEQLGMVEVIHHPTNILADLNYVMPRRNTAWVSGQFIEEGLGFMRSHERLPRVQYIEGLYPPLFARTLRDLGLQPEREIPLMVYAADSPVDALKPPPITLPSPPDGVNIDQVSNQMGMTAWWYVWRNAMYDVLTLGVEPLALGSDMAALFSGRQLDFIAYRHGFPAGVARVSLNDKTGTAHIMALAMLREVRTPDINRLLLAHAVQGALERGYRIVFAPGESESERVVCRELGFMDFGSVVCYAASSERIPPTPNINGNLPQPLLTLR